MHFLKGHGAPGPKGASGLPGPIGEKGKSEWWTDAYKLHSLLLNYTVKNSNFEFNANMLIEHYSSNLCMVKSDCIASICKFHLNFFIQLCHL